MVKTKVLLYLLGIFIVTIMLIVFLQYNSNRNVNQLIQGNQQLLTELQRRIAIHTLRENLFYVSAEERKMLSQPLMTLHPDMTNRRKRIATEIEYLKNLDAGNHNPGLMKLDSLVAQLLSFHNNVLDTLDGRRELQTKMIMSRLSDSLLNEVVETSRQLNIERDEYLARLIETTDKNGIKAKEWGIILAILAIAASIYAYFFITNKIRIQEQLINQLNVSEKKVREAARIKENFMANMSHEIRTPMNAILGFTQLLRKEELNEKSEEYIHSIQSAGEHLLTIINDVLDFSKMEAGMLRIETRPFALRSVLDSVERMFAEKARQKNILLRVIVSDAIPDTIQGDPVRLKQILVNVIGNAIKFTPTGSVLVKVINEDQNGNEIKLKFTIKDSGIGIPVDKIGYIFERFNQVDEDASRKFGGTGLGLSIVKQLVEMQKGKIRVTSEVNRGTELNISIPYGFHDAEIKIQPLENIENFESFYLPNYPNHTSNPLILVIEDNILNQSLMKHLLSNWKFNFTIVSNGEDGIAALRNRTFDLVLMDIQMPGLDGYMTTEKIRAELKSTVPIIAMTAHAMNGEKEKCLSRGMNAYISKPLEETELFNLIVYYTNQSSLQASQPAHPMQVIDLKYLWELSAGKSSFVQKMITQFLSQANKDLAALENSFGKGDYSLVKATAHNLKTSVSFVGLTAKLDLPLSYIEDRVLTEQDGKFIVIAISTVKAICDQALEEARAYLAEYAVLETIT